MPICVFGMHRSGTSMITRMLVSCGLEVGPSSELLGPTSENPTGYFERQSMVLVNDGVLASFGAAWDHLPRPLPARWWEDPALAPLEQRGRALLADFPPGRAWGWKDPRNSITLPFWDALVGEPAAAVLCVRNPLDVAASLARRGSMSPQLALHLWSSYSESALALARDGRAHVMTHYDAYFEDPRAEVERVATAVGLDPGGDQVVAAAAAARPEHRHGSSGLAALVASRASDEVVALYIELCAVAGPVFDQVAGRDPLVVTSDDDEPVVRSQTVEWVRRFREENFPQLEVSGRSS